MGIKDLFKTLNVNSLASKREDIMERLHGAAAGFDVSVTLHSLITRHPGAISTYIYVSGVNQSEFEHAVRLMVDMFEEYVNKLVNQLGISPVFVFDGRHFPPKSRVDQERAAAAQRAWDAGRAMQKDPAYASDYTKLMAVAARVPHELTAAIIGLIKRMPSARYIVAPYEADAQLVELLASSEIEIIVSVDSDILVFAAAACWSSRLQDFRVLLKSNLTSPTGNLGATAVLYERRHLADWLAQSHLNERAFVLLSVLSGCDYFSWQGLGPATARKIVDSSLDDIDIACSLLSKKFRNFDSEAAEQVKLAFTCFFAYPVYNPGRAPTELTYLCENFAPLPQLPDFQGLDDHVKGNISRTGVDVSNIVNYFETARPLKKEALAEIAEGFPDRSWTFTETRLRGCLPHIAQETIFVYFLTSDACDQRTRWNQQDLLRGIDRAVSLPKLRVFAFHYGDATREDHRVQHLRLQCQPSMKSESYQVYVSVLVRSPADSYEVAHDWARNGKVCGTVVEVLKASCQCPAGKDEHCGHVAALLWVLYFFRLFDSEEVMSCTQQACAWIKPRAKGGLQDISLATPACEVVFEKPKKAASMLASLIEPDALISAPAPQKKRMKRLHHTRPPLKLKVDEAKLKQALSNLNKEGFGFDVDAVVARARPQE